MSSEDTVRDWLADFAACVRRRDIAGALPLFSADAIGFGTRVAIASGRTDLAADQWTPIWQNTSGFDFTDTTVVGVGSDTAVVATLWSSTADVDGRVRSGRATIALVAADDARHGWVCTHTHFSFRPVPEEF